MKDSLFFFDIEAKAHPEAIVLLPEPFAPASYTDPEKIAQYAESKAMEQVVAIAHQSGLDGVKEVHSGELS